MLCSGLHPPAPWSSDLWLGAARGRPQQKMGGQEECVNSLGYLPALTLWAGCAALSKPTAPVRWPSRYIFCLQCLSPRPGPSVVESRSAVGPSEAPSLFVSLKPISLGQQECALRALPDPDIATLNTAIVCLEMMAVPASLNYSPKLHLKFLFLLPLTWADKVSDRLALRHVRWRHAVSFCLVFGTDCGKVALAFAGNRNNCSFQEQCMLLFGFWNLICPQQQQSTGEENSVLFSTEPFRAYQSFIKMGRNCIAGLAYSV